LGSDSTLDTGNTAWMLTSSAMVMLMTPGVALFYGGLSGKANVANTMLLVYVTMAIVTIEWVLIGYSFSFGTNQTQINVGY